MPFTFHYGPIQIISSEEAQKEIAIYIPLWSYSNIKGDLISSAIAKFTFHYGPIQICFSLNIFLYSIIYIPLWSYSNPATAISKLHLTCIYIPLWSYSNANMVDFEPLEDKFTFHYGPIQIDTYKKIQTQSLKFTFHYGPIQINDGYY